MKVTRIVVRDFQAHRRLAVRLGRITTFVGPTDVGKSAILRALRWACLNDLPGADFVRDGAPRAVVTLFVRSRGAKFVIRRIKGSGVNLYQVNGVDYKAFGAQPPTDVQALLRMEELNCQDQHDGPFWLSRTAGEVSRQLNAIVDLTVMDDALAHAAAKVRIATERIGVVTSQLEALRREAEEAKKHRKRFEQLKRLRKTKAAFVEAVNFAGVLAHFLTEAKEHEAVKVPPDFSRVEKLWLKLQEVKQRGVALAELADWLEQTQNSFRKANELERKFHSKVTGKVCPLCHQIIRM